ncbi:MAG: DEAD/DEAH box helicase, partial [Pseudorhodobacter sp.]|nr:DEAD/DEAH box helicase [Pseudorhodobacter sp.]
MNDPRALLHSVFGFADYRPGQEEIVDAVLAGRNTLAIMPTGGGKSLCFQLPAICRDGVTVVISPLIALMRDQVRALKAVGIEAGALTSGNTEEETEEVFQALDDGRLKLLYIAPERLAAAATLSMLGRAPGSSVSLGDAHWSCQREPA